MKEEERQGRKRDLQGNMEKKKRKRESEECKHGEYLVNKRQYKMYLIKLVLNENKAKAIKHFTNLPFSVLNPLLFCFSLCFFITTINNFIWEFKRAFHAPIETHCHLQ